MDDDFAFKAEIFAMMRDNGIDADSETGQIILSVVAMVQRMERDLAQERRAREENTN